MISLSLVISVTFLSLQRLLHLLEEGTGVHFEGKSYTQTSAILSHSCVLYNQVDNRKSRMVTSRGWRAEDSIAVLCDGSSIDKIKSMD